MTLENSESRPSWSLVTSHGLVLFYIANHASATIREVAAEVGLTERRVLEILKDLKNVDLITIVRSGRRNIYGLKPGAKFRHPHLANLSVETFLAMVEESNRGEPDATGLRS